MQTTSICRPHPQRALARGPTEPAWTPWRARLQAYVAPAPELSAIEEEAAYASDDSSATIRPMPRSPTPTPPSPKQPVKRAMQAMAPAQPLRLTCPPAPDELDTPLDDRCASAFFSLHNTFESDWPQYVHLLCGKPEEAEALSLEAATVLNRCAKLQCLGLRGERPANADVQLWAIRRAFYAFVERRERDFVSSHLQQLGSAVEQSVGQNASVRVARYVREAIIEQLQEMLHQSAAGRLAPGALRSDLERVLAMASPLERSPACHSKRPQPAIEHLLAAFDEQTSFVGMEARVDYIEGLLSRATRVSSGN